MKRHPDIIKVGIIRNSSGTDDKFIDLDIVFNNNKRLYLTGVNYRNLVGRVLCSIVRVGDYVFDPYFQYVSDMGECYRPETIPYNKFGYGSVPSDLIEKEMGLKFRDINSIINNYDKLLKYIDSLPNSIDYAQYIDKNRIWGMENIKKIRRMGKRRTAMGDIDGPWYYGTYILCKNSWNDKMYERKIFDYDTNEIVFPSKKNYK
jgi:hypothetical protein